MIKAKTFRQINDFRSWAETYGVARDDVIYFGSNASGMIDVVYSDVSDGAGSVIEATAVADRAIHDAQGVDKPLDATQVAAAGPPTLTFDAATGTVTRSAGDFLADSYSPNMALEVAGTADNDGTYLIDTVTALVITIDADADTDTYETAFTDEGPLGGGETLDASQVGYDVGHGKYLHVIVSLPDAATSLDWSLYTWDSTSEQWCLDTTIGTAGVVSLTAADADNPQRTIIPLRGEEKALIEIASSAGVFTTGYSVWMEVA